MKEGNEALLEQQAIISITRSLLARNVPEEEGMHMTSNHIIVPCHLDILPLLTLVADDYTEFVEPEPEKEFSAPFVPYWDGLSLQESNEGLVERFLLPRWFVYGNDQLTLGDVIRNYSPQVCVLLGTSPQTRKRLRALKYTFQHIIAFEALTRSEAERKIQSMAQRITIADRQFQAAIADTRRDFPVDRPNQFGYWENMFQKDEELPSLEPFVAFGPAFEMAMFLSNKSF